MAKEWLFGRLKIARTHKDCKRAVHLQHSSLSADVLIDEPCRRFGEGNFFSPWEPLYRYTPRYLPPLIALPLLPASFFPASQVPAHKPCCGSRCFLTGLAHGLCIRDCDSRASFLAHSSPSAQLLQSLPPQSLGVGRQKPSLGLSTNDSALTEASVARLRGASVDVCINI